MQRNYLSNVERNWKSTPLPVYSLNVEPLNLLLSLSHAWVKALGTVSECFVFVPSRSGREPVMNGAMVQWLVGGRVAGSILSLEHFVKFWTFTVLF